MAGRRGRRDPHRAAPRRSRAGSSVAVPVGSLVVAFVVMTRRPARHAATRRCDTFRRLFDAAFVGRRRAQRRRSSPRRRSSSPGSAPRSRSGCSSSTSAARASSTPARSSAPRAASRSAITPAGSSIPAMIAAGAVGGAALALIPAVLRAFFSTNEIITSLMLNYVAALVLNYLIFDSQSYWRDTSSRDGEGLPAGQEPAGRRRLADVEHRRSSCCRSGCCSASQSPSASGCSTRARGSGSRCR